MTATKPILQEFLTWMEVAYGHPEGGTSSEFVVQPPPETLAFAEMALEAALRGDRPVVLGTDVTVKSVLGALVLKRAGVKVEHVLEGCLTEDQFVALADTLREVKNSRLLLELRIEKPVASTIND